MLLVFYFLLVRPQQKQEQQRQEALQRIAKGDTVITSGGLIGVIHAVKDSEFVVEFDEKVRIRVAREDVDPYTAPEPKAN
jgi:preprotein translocase subunit YajC